MNLLSRLCVLLSAGVLLLSPQLSTAQNSNAQRSNSPAAAALSARRAAHATRPQNKDLRAVARTIAIKRKGVTTRYTQHVQIHLKHLSAADKAQLAAKTPSKPRPSASKPITVTFTAAAGTVHPRYGGPPTTVVTSQGFGTATIGGQPVVKTITYAPPTTDTTLTFTLTAGASFTLQSSSCETTSCTATVSFAPQFPGQLTDALTVTDSAGNLIDQTFLAGVGTGPQFAFQFGSTSADDESASKPFGAAFGPDGNYYVVDQATQLILEFGSDGFLNSTPISGLCNPQGIAVDGTGTIYIADPTFNRVLSYTAQGLESVVKTTPLLHPSWVAVDGTGALYISDTGNNRIIKIDNQNVETTVQSGLNAPAGIALDAAGDLFFADANNEGEISELQASTGQVVSITNQLGTVQALATDASGRVFFTTSQGLTIFNPATGDSITEEANEDEGAPNAVAVAPDGRILTTSFEEIDITLASSGQLGNLYTQINSSASETQTIANNGNSPLTFSSLTTQGPIFTIDGNTQCNPEIALAPGASCDVKLDFTPTQATSYTDNLTATSNSHNLPGTRNTASLEGIGEGFPTQTTLTVSPMNGPAGATLTFTAVVSGATQGIPAPTGNVDFYANGEIIGTVTLADGNTTAVLTTSQLASGTYEFFAIYDGDGNNAESFSNVIDNDTVGIGTGTITTSLTSSPASPVLGQAVTLTATFTGQFSAAPTGTVSFSNDDTPLGSVTLTPNGNVATASVSVSTLYGGQNRIYATFPGDANYAATYAATTIQVALGPSTTVLTITPSPATTTQTVSLTATITSGTNPPEDGEVIFSDQNGEIGRAYFISPTSTGGTATLPTNLSVGTHQITALFTGDENYTDSTSNTQTIVITPGGPAINLTDSAANINLGQTEILTVQLGSFGQYGQYGQPGPDRPPAPTGTVTFSDQHGVLGTATVCACATGPAASIALSTLTAGVHQITATYNGDANYAAATSNTQTVTVGTAATLAATTTTLSVSAPAIIVGQPETLTASVTSLSAPPGTVTFADQNGPLGSATLGTGDSTSQATLTLSTLSVGTHLIEATYSGNATYAASASPQQTVTVAALGTQVITFPSIPNHIVGDAPFTLAATASSGLPVTYTVVSGPATVSGNLVTLTGAIGTVVIQASQAGGSTFAAAAPVTQSFNVTLAPVLSLTSISPSSGAIGSPATTITLTGTDFSTSDVVLLNGTAIPSTYVGPTTLTATLPAGFFVTAGTGLLTIRDTSTQTVTSGLPFTVSNSPQIVFTGPTTAVSAQQPTVTFQLVNPYPVALAGTLALTFTPSTPSGINDPNVQFASGGRSLAFNIPADSTVTPPIQLQTGTVAGTATISLAVTANGVVVTPTNIAPVTIVIPAAVPTITSTRLTRNGNTLTISVVGYSNTREAIQAAFHFNAVPGSTIDNPDLMLTVGANFAGWYVTPDSDNYGSAFTYTQDFTLDQDSALIQNVTVTLANTIGSSAPSLTP